MCRKIGVVCTADSLSSRFNPIKSNYSRSTLYWNTGNTLFIQIKIMNSHLPPLPKKSLQIGDSVFLRLVRKKPESPNFKPLSVAMWPSSREASFGKSKV